MKLVWTKSKSPLSVIIRLITGDPCSHFAFVFQTKVKGLMFESNLLGTHPAFFQTALKKITIVHEIDIPLTIKQEDRIWDLIIEKYDDKPYNFLGAIYLGWRKILNRVFKIPMPEKNKWSMKDAYFCNQIYDVLNRIPGVPNVDVLDGMDTPEDVYQRIKFLENLK